MKTESDFANSPPAFRPIAALPVDFGDDTAEFRVQYIAATYEGSRCRLCRQRARSIEEFADIVDAAINGLQCAKAVVGVPNALPQNGLVTAETVSDGESGRVVSAGEIRRPEAARPIVFAWFSLVTRRYS